MEKTQPEGVTSWVAYQDVQSAAHMAQLLARVRIQRQIAFKLDRQRVEEDWNICQVSFGLGYNLTTDKVQKQFEKNPDGKGEKALPFDTDYGHGSLAENGGSSKTDNILWQGELIRPPKGRDHAIIVRVVHGDPGYATFICAVRTAYGTTAAGLFLAKHWNDVLKNEYNKIIKLPKTDDEEEVRLETHSLFVMIEHAANDPHMLRVSPDILRIPQSNLSTSRQ